MSGTHNGRMGRPCKHCSLSNDTGWTFCDIRYFIKIDSWFWKIIHFYNKQIL